MKPDFPVFLHGGDYNPDQWLDRPDILEADVRMMKKAHVNAVSLGIFSWSRLEPEEGVYDFGWLDGVMNRLTEAGISIALATPSGARPAWLAQKYPEVLRCGPDFQRMHFGERHNHCLTSPVYREKVRAIDAALAERYAKHPGVILWHIGNEFGGECRCPLCAEAFRGWLRNKYGTLDDLNRRWWTDFWSHRYTAWEQIEPPSPAGDQCNPSMRVDWRRFVTSQVRSFIEMERDAVKAFNPALPVTANLMERFWDYDYFELAKAIDVVSWDCYPAWHGADDLQRAAEFAMNHDLMRSLKHKPFLMIESTPSLVNWKDVNKLKRPGMHLLSSMQAVAHGSQSVMMFQWRKGRGGSEAFHGAVVSHDGRDDTRVFRDVEQVGAALERLTPVLGEERKAEVCLLFDWENRWALDFAQMGRRGAMQYFDTCVRYYRALWERGIAVDLRDMSEATDLSGYRLVVAPMLFMFRNGMDERLRRYVEAGGTLLVTYLSGIVDADDLAFLGDAPHGLTDVLGLRAEELDTLYPGETNSLKLEGGVSVPVSRYCELPEDVTARVVGTYGEDFYAGRPCLTVNRFGRGKAWYLAAEPDTEQAMRTVLARVTEDLSLTAALPETLPQGVVATGRGRAVFVQNYTAETQTLWLTDAWRDLITGDVRQGTAVLPPYGVWALMKADGGSQA